MLAGLKTQWSHCAARPHPAWKYGQGFFAEQLHQALEAPPVQLWNDIRRQRSYLNQVLARAEVDTSYKPARKLWMRSRNGHYLPNPAMLLRQRDGWRPVYGALETGLGRSRYRRRKRIWRTTDGNSCAAR